MKLKIRIPETVSGPPSPVELSWRDGDLEESVTSLGKFVEFLTLRQIHWYYERRKWKSRFSRGLRLLSLILFAVGGAVPVVQAALPSLSKQAALGAVEFSQLGYLFLGAAAACLAFDRFFGFSSGWMRYMTTASALEALLEQFRMDWAERTARLRGRPPSPAQMEELIQICRSTAASVHSAVEHETLAWVAEFQSGLARMEQSLRRNSPGQR